MSNCFVTPQTVAHQPSLSDGCPRQNYQSGLPRSPPGDLPNPIDPHLLWLLHGMWILYHYVTGEAPLIDKVQAEFEPKMASVLIATIQ